MVKWNSSWYLDAVSNNPDSKTRLNQSELCETRDLKHTHTVQAMNYFIIIITLHVLQEAWDVEQRQFRLSVQGHGRSTNWGAGAAGGDVVCIDVMLYQRPDVASKA